MEQLPRALIPQHHKLFGIYFGSISAQSTTAYILSIPHRNYNSNNQCEKSPQQVADPDKWLQQKVSDTTKPIFLEGTQNFSSQI